MIKFSDAVFNLVGQGFTGPTNGPLSEYTFEMEAPTKADVDAELIRLEKEYSDNEYARNRASAYDSIGDQLDMIYKDNLNGTTTHKESVEAVKAKYPKPA